MSYHCLKHKQQELIDTVSVCALYFYDDIGMSSDHWQTFVTCLTEGHDVDVLVTDLFDRMP